jgi:uncharacterized protein YggU (UPF0235/DUF167 family)
VLLKVKVHPAASGIRFAVKNDVLHVWLTEPAENNRANRQLLRELSALAGPCRLVRGATSSTKTVACPVPLKTLQGKLPQ